MEQGQKRPLVVVANPDAGELRNAETALFSRGFRVVTARTAHEVLEKTHQHEPDAIVLDRQLAGPAFALCENLRADPALSTVAPILITQSTPSISEDRIDALRAGAWHLLGEPRLADELLAYLHAFLEPKLETDRLKNECMIDRGSGLYNHAGFIQRADELSALTARQGLPTACAVFRPAKSLADHQEVDRVGQAFKAAGRTSDAIGRVGSAEFAVFAPAATAWAAARLMQRMTTQVSAHIPVTVRAAYSAALATQKIPPALLLERARASLDASIPR